MNGLLTTSDFSSLGSDLIVNTDQDPFPIQIADLSSESFRVFVTKKRREKVILETPAGIFCETTEQNIFNSHTAVLRHLSSDLYSLNNYIGCCMGKIPRVERVYSAYRDRTFYTWIIIDDRDEETLKTIYEEEKLIIDIFSEYEFDFYILYRRDQEIDSMVSSDIELVFPRIH